MLFPQLTALINRRELGAALQVSQQLSWGPRFHSQGNHLCLPWKEWGGPLLWGRC